MILFHIWAIGFVFFLGRSTENLIVEGTMDGGLTLDILHSILVSAFWPLYVGCEAYDHIIKRSPP